MNQQKQAGASCGDPMCNSEENLVQAPTCDASGQCQMSGVQDCGAYKCADPDGSPATCPDTCEADEDCKTDNYCFDRPDDSDGDKECHPNRPPVAKAGQDQGGYKKDQVVQLDGSQSSDPDGDMLSYQWELTGVECPVMGQEDQADLQAYRSYLADTMTSRWDPTEASASFELMPPQCDREILTFELTVNDGEFDNTERPNAPEDEDATATVQYGDCGTQPTAVISGEPSNVDWGDEFTLDGSRSTPGCGDSLSYSWSVEPMGEPLTTTELSDGEELQVELDDICRDRETELTFNLSVYDGVKNSEQFPETITVRPNGPCEGDESSSPDAGPDSGAPTDLGNVNRGGDISGSSCFCAAPGEGQSPAVPVSLLAALVVGGAVRRRRRR